MCIYIYIYLYTVEWLFFSVLFSRFFPNDLKRE